MDVTVPKIADDVDTAEVVRVLVQKGDEVTAEQPLLELEGDKASFELPSPRAGTVSDVCVKAGDEVVEGDLVVVLTEAGTGGEDESVSPDDREEAGDADRTEAEASDETSASSERPIDANAAATPADTAPVRATPAARRRARELDLQLEAVATSSRAPRITPQEVERHRDEVAEAPDAATAGERVELSRRRRRTGAVMAEAWRTIPHVTQHHRVEVGALETARRQLNASLEDDASPVTWTALAVKAFVGALKKHPRFNARLGEDGEHLHLYAEIHVAIATDAPRGLIAPVLRAAQDASLRQVATELAHLQRRVEEEDIDAETLRGATVTLSNLGAVGGGHFTPIITPPQVAVLGLGRAFRGGDPRDGAASGRGSLWLPLSLSYDHRVADGAEAARLLRAVKARLANPLSLLLDG